MRYRALVSAVALSIVVTSATGCSSDPYAPDAALPLPAVTVGSGTSVVSDLMARIYAGALASMGTHVTTRFDLNDEYAALDNDVTLVPAFTGDLLARYFPGADDREPTQVAKSVSGSLPQGFSISDFSDTTDWRARLMVTDVYAQQHNLQSVSDLVPECGSLILGIPQGSQIPNLGDTYHCNGVVMHVMSIDQLLRAVAQGQVTAVLVPPAIMTTGLQALTDDKYAVVAENPVPLFRANAITINQVRRLNLVAGELKTDDFRVTVKSVLNGRSAQDAARDWLRAHGF